MAIQQLRPTALDKVAPLVTSISMCLLLATSRTMFVHTVVFEIWCPFFVPRHCFTEVRLRLHESPEFSAVGVLMSWCGGL
jgi:hypothetical protein